MKSIKLKEHPEVLRVIRAAFPNYKKQSATIFEFRSACINSYWDGGSKDVYALVRLTDLRSLPLPSSTHPYFDCHGANAQGEGIVVENGNITLTALPENVVLVRGGTFMGKPSSASVYVRSENMTKFLC